MLGGGKCSTTIRIDSIIYIVGQNIKNILQFMEHLNQYFAYQNTYLVNRQHEEILYKNLAYKTILVKTGFDGNLSTLPAVRKYNNLEVIWNLFSQIF